MTILLNTIDSLSVDSETSKRVWDHFYNSHADLDEYGAFLLDKGIASTGDRFRKDIESLKKANTALKEEAKADKHLLSLKKANTALKEEAKADKHLLSQNSRVIRILFCAMSFLLLITLILGIKLRKRNVMNASLNEINALNMLFENEPVWPFDDDKGKMTWLKVGPFDQNDILKWRKERTLP